MELLHVVLGNYEELAVVRRTAVGPHGQTIWEERRRRCEGELQREVVDLFEDCGCIARDHPVGGAFRVIRIQRHILPPEEDVVHSEGCAVRPLGPLSEEERPFGLIVVGLPALGKAASFVKTVA
jgi:hypothetical protein